MMTMFWILVAAVVTAVLIYRVFRSYGKTSGSSIRSEKWPMRYMSVLLLRYGAYTPP